MELNLQSSCHWRFRDLRADLAVYAEYRHVGDDSDSYGTVIDAMETRGRPTFVPPKRAVGNVGIGCSLQPLFCRPPFATYRLGGKESRKHRVRVAYPAFVSESPSLKSKEGPTVQPEAGNRAHRFDILH